jgi:outer membrane protein assembly factor BamB
MGTNQFKIFVLLFVCLVSPLLSGNDSSSLKAPKAVQAKAFVKRVEGAGRVMDAIQTADGNYVSISSTGAAIWIVRKVTMTGTRIWERSLSFQVADGGHVTLGSIAQTNDGYVLVGEGTFDGDPGISFSTAIVVALHSDGTVKWSKRFDQNGNLYFFSATSSPDGGFIVTGGAYPPDFHPILVKFTSTGDVQWQKAFYNMFFPFLSQRASDNGVIVASQLSNGANVFKLDASGNIVWGRRLKINAFSLHSLGRTSDNGVILAGTSINSSTLSLISLNSKGELGWKASYSLTLLGISISNLIPTPDGGYAMTGASSNNSRSPRSGFLLKIDALKNLAFQKSFGFRDIPDEGRDVFTTNEGSYVLFGSSGQDMLFFRLNSDGILPGCVLFHNLKSKKVRSGAVTSDPLAISPDALTVPSANSIQLESVVSRKPSSTECQ